MIEDHKVPILPLEWGYSMRKVLFVGVLVGITSLPSVQGQAVSASAATASSSTTMSAKAGSVSRTTKAVHYRQGGQLKILFQSTDLLAGASGEAKVEGKKTSVTIDAKFQSVEDATKFGLEYLTYVLWAISPEGRAGSLEE